jgi:glycosyltransferase involved in cell wall biosynthesis
MRILLIGNMTFYHVGAFFRNALQALGQPHLALDQSLYEQIAWPPMARKIAFRLMGRRPLGYWRLNRDILAAARDFGPEIVLITGSCPVAASTLRELKERMGALLVNYATDHPFNRLVCARWVAANIPLYDLYVCTKRAIMDDVRAAGCRRVAFVPFGYEPSLHFPDDFSSREEFDRFTCDVVFVGGGDRDRYPYFEALVGGIPHLRLNLYGGYWDRNPTLRRYARGLALGRDYRLALRGAKIAPCLVRRANRDGHVMRSFELPACGAFMLAQRTVEHQEFFREGEEVAYFSSPAELVEKVRYYLKHDDERQRMAEAAHHRVTTANHTYANRLEQILELAGALICERRGVARSTEAQKNVDVLGPPTGVCEPAAKLAASRRES